jgi:hypothetical protein
MDGNRIQQNPILSKLGTYHFSRKRNVFASESNRNVFAGESIRLRLFLTPYELTSTYRNINNKFIVKYYPNLVLQVEGDHDIPHPRI